MASIGHLAVGAAIGAVYSRTTGSNPRTTIAAFASLALAPDLDLVAGLFQAPPGTALAHRGLSHSLVFAVLVAGLIALVAPGRRRRDQVGVGGFTLAAIASHGVLDTLSQLGDGPMLFWPFSYAHYEFIWRPIPGVLSASHYLTLESFPALALETAIFLPLILFALVSLFPRPVDKPQASH